MQLFKLTVLASVLCVATAAVISNDHNVVNNPLLDRRGLVRIPQSSTIEPNSHLSLQRVSAGGVVARIISQLIAYYPHRLSRRTRYDFTGHRSLNPILTHCFSST
ncbi:hypothetical protein C8R47DRAFT_1171560 [Mycena vitilis]|nr:hypothetical protein C8R47DRAFT_1171560 [Mycena vitilis]